MRVLKSIKTQNLKETVMQHEYLIVLRKVMTVEIYIER